MDEDDYINGGEVDEIIIKLAILAFVWLIQVSIRLIFLYIESQLGEPPRNSQKNHPPPPLP